MQDFLSFSQQVSVPLLDVRSPGEFAAGHIPGAKNTPLFTNEQRVDSVVTLGRLLSTLSAPFLFSSGP